MKTIKKRYDVVIVGSGPAGLGAAFKLTENSDKSILLLEKKSISSGGLRNDCKQNYTYPVGFPLEHWGRENATALLEEVKAHLHPKIQPKNDISKYRASLKTLCTDSFMRVFIDEAEFCRTTCK